MDLLKTFTNHEFNCALTTVEHDDKLYFKANDVAKALGYACPKRAVYDHVPDCFKTTFDEIVRDAAVPFQHRPDYNEGRAIYVSEPGLYKLACSSKMPNAVQFQEWVFNDVFMHQSKNWFIFYQS